MNIYRVSTMFNDGKDDYPVYEAVVVAEDEEQATELLVEYDSNPEWEDDTTVVAILGVASPDLVEGVVLTNHEIEELAVDEEAVAAVLAGE